MAKHAPSLICPNCGAVCDRPQGRCDVCGELRQTPQPSFASLLMSIPSGGFQRDQAPVRDVDL
jgi:predicted ATP-dependent serine protease